MSGVAVRHGTSADIEAAVSVWKASNAARRGGRPAPPEYEERARSHVKNPDSLLFVADGETGIVGMAVGMQGLADDGAGPPIEGLCHIGMVFVAPDNWGEGIGGMLVDTVLDEARSRGYGKAQLWAHKDNPRARRLYERRGFGRSGREKKDDLGEGSSTMNATCDTESGQWFRARHPGASPGGASPRMGRPFAKETTRLHDGVRFSGSDQPDSV